ncbi:LOW QUALITY PROTEIN: hypothetical protein PanWU01x14_166090 [Parasponia andersonii]|uniref:Transmembrane protein n=1 Tax=Parasponia andersonii TaxID=3476 RepID=A0A2P5CBJ2_PARAD|nr:LOW QUALITY PROTEIN: hypothetical protein PanWU01x14_166090 [Parasponia andersonii]
MTLKLRGAKSTRPHPLKHKNKQNKTQHNRPSSAYTLLSGFPNFNQSLGPLFLFSYLSSSQDPLSPATFTFPCVSIYYSFGLFWVKKQTQNNVFKERKSTLCMIAFTAIQSFILIFFFLKWATQSFVFKGYIKSWPIKINQVQVGS